MRSQLVLVLPRPCPTGAALAIPTLAIPEMPILQSETATASGTEIGTVTETEI